MDRICEELTLHAQVEEEVFYPAVKKALKDRKLIPTAAVEHETLKMLIAQVTGADVTDDMYTARVRVMGEYLKHHVREEQSAIFPRVKASRLDMKELGKVMRQRRQQLANPPVITGW